MSTTKSIPTGVFKAANTLRMAVTGTYIPSANSFISLTPSQAHMIVDICERLNIAAPVRDGELSSWLHNTCNAFIGYLSASRKRIASQDATDVIIACLRDARDGKAGYSRMAELERAEVYCSKQNL